MLKSYSFYIKGENMTFFCEECKEEIHECICQEEEHFDTSVNGIPSCKKCGYPIDDCKCESNSHEDEEE